MKCPNCGSTSTSRNDGRGETVCTDCGMVLAEAEMVDQLTFHDGGKMSGSFVDARTGQTRGFASVMGNRNSREISLAKGFNNLERVASKLNLGTNMVESAKRLYHLALQRNFTLGRNNFYVVSSCLYAICRREKLGYLLIDFSDILRTPIKTICQVYMKMIRTLCISVPHIDPSLLIDRFVNQLDIAHLFEPDESLAMLENGEAQPDPVSQGANASSKGANASGKDGNASGRDGNASGLDGNASGLDDGFFENSSPKNSKNPWTTAKKREVMETSIRIIQAMERNWINTGRRPLGLCGASILIAIRFHGLRINASDINKLFRISSDTINQRLQEFSKTPAASLSIEDFNQIDPKSAPFNPLPPCSMRELEAERKRAALMDGLGLGGFLPSSSVGLPIMDANMPNGSAPEESSGALAVKRRSKRSIMRDRARLEMLKSQSDLLGDVLALGEQVTEPGEQTGHESTEDLEKRLQEADLYGEAVNARRIEPGSVPLYARPESTAAKKNIASLTSALARALTDTVDDISEDCLGLRAPPPEQKAILDGSDSQLMTDVPNSSLASSNLSSLHSETPLDSTPAPVLESQSDALTRTVVQVAKETLPSILNEFGEPDFQDLWPSDTDFSKGVRTPASEPGSFVAADGSNTALSVAKSSSDGQSTAKSLALSEALIARGNDETPTKTRRNLVEDEGIFAEDLSDLLDGDISDTEDPMADMLLLSEGEKAAKALIWDEEVKDIIARVWERDRQRKMRRVAQDNDKKKRMKTQPIPMNSVIESVKASLTKSASTGLVEALNEKTVQELFA